MHTHPPPPAPSPGNHTKQGLCLSRRRTTNWKKMQIVFLKVSHEPPARSSGPFCQWPTSLIRKRSSGPIHPLSCLPLALRLNSWDDLQVPLTPATLVEEMTALSALTSLGPAPCDSNPRPTRPPRSEGGADTWGASRTAPWAPAPAGLLVRPVLLPTVPTDRLSTHRLLGNKPGPRGQGSACKTGKCGPI